MVQQSTAMILTRQNEFSVFGGRIFITGDARDTKAEGGTERGRKGLQICCPHATLTQKNGCLVARICVILINFAMDLRCTHVMGTPERPLQNG